MINQVVCSVNQSQLTVLGCTVTSTKSLESSAAVSSETQVFYPQVSDVRSTPFNVRQKPFSFKDIPRVIEKPVPACSHGIRVRHKYHLSEYPTNVGTTSLSQPIALQIRPYLFTIPTSSSSPKTIVCIPKQLCRSTFQPLTALSFHIFHPHAVSNTPLKIPSKQYLNPSSTLSIVPAEKLNEK